MQQSIGLTYHTTQFYAILPFQVLSLFFLKYLNTTPFHTILPFQVLSLLLKYLKVSFFKKKKKKHTPYPVYYTHPTFKIPCLPSYGPRIFSMMCSHSNGETCFFIYLVKNMFFRKDLESPLIFVLFLKGKQNKKENPKCDSLFKKTGLWKTESGSEIRLPIRKVRWWAVTPL